MRGQNSGNTLAKSGMRTLKCLGAKMHLRKIASLRGLVAQGDDAFIALNVTPKIRAGLISVRHAPGYVDFAGAGDFDCGFHFILQKRWGRSPEGWLYVAIAD